VGERLSGWRRRVRGMGMVAALGVGLIACGESQQQADENTAQEGGSVPVSTLTEGVTGEMVVLASPGPDRTDVGRVATPEGTPPMENRVIEAEGTIVSLQDGQLEPNRLEGTPGESFVLIINGDGTEHTIEIEGLVQEERIAAEGQTRVEFTVAEEPGEYPILIDGEEAGIFASQSAGGIS
jgi:hypothetical protein